MKLFVGNFLCLFCGGHNKVWLNLKKLKVEINQICPKLEAYVTRRNLYCLSLGSAKFIG